MKKFRFIFLPLALFAFLFLTAANADAQQTPLKSEETPTAQNKNAAIDFDFTDLGGKAHKFSEFRGKVVLLDFWATWCAPCLADIPKLKAVYEKYKAKGFEIVGLNAEALGDDAVDAETAKENAANVNRVVTTRKVNWTIATSETSVPVATKIFGIESLPAKILIDKDGKIIAVGGEKDDLEEIVAKLLAAK